MLTHRAQELGWRLDATSVLQEGRVNVSKMSPNSRYERTPAQDEKLFDCEVFWTE